MKILVLCTGNSARSILLENLLNRLGKSRVEAFSAGSHPTGVVHPQTLELLRSKGYDVAGLRSKSWDEFSGENAPVMDLVITVCGSAAAETCPIWPSTTQGFPLRAHWGIDDPAAAKSEDWPAAFSQAYTRLAGRANAFIALPFEDMARADLQAALDDIGNSSA
ncbi:MAG: arsenate reductase ArsC [Rhodobacterales bacterium]|nr:arsenate reductase ArsC [Rhodobacterales bacterium]